MPTEANAAVQSSTVQAGETTTGGKSNGARSVCRIDMLYLESVLGKKVRRLLAAQRRMCRRLDEALVELDRKIEDKPENKNGRS